MERAWLIVSIACLVVAAFLLYRRNQDAAFVVSALGAIAWILSYRIKLRRATPKADATSEDVDNVEVNEEQEDE